MIGGDRTKPEYPLSEGDERRLRAIFARALVQSSHHERNLQKIFCILLEELESEFAEDNRATLIDFARENLEVAQRNLQWGQAAPTSCGVLETHEKN